MNISDIPLKEHVLNVLLAILNTFKCMSRQIIYKVVDVSTYCLKSLKTVDYVNAISIDIMTLTKHC